MRKMIGRMCAIATAAVVLAGSVMSGLSCRVYASDDKGLVAAATQQPFRVLSAQEMVREMGSGWNLGNTMDGHTGFTPNETLWQHVETTKQVIKTVHDNGFNTVRIPVTWGTMIDDENGYAINDKWLSRVQDIVDYCVEQDMYVIVNIHHDGAEQTGWLRIASDDFDSVKEKYEAVWKQIAGRFKDYDEHLIFESMNEVTGPGNNIQFDMDRVMELNQVFVDTVRGTGSNNAYRWLSVPGRYTNITNTTQYDFRLPEDTVENRLFLSVHYYNFLFGLAENTTYTEWTKEMTDELVEEFAQLEKFTLQGVPVIVGEYGAVDKRNEADRAYHYEVVNRICNTGMIVACYWDNGEYDLTKEPTDYNFTLIDRESCEPVYPDLVAAILRGKYLAGPSDCSDLSKGTEIIPITDFGLEKDELCIEVGALYETSVKDILPEDTNDIVLWKTDDPSVATVYDGRIRARGIGTTTITAYSQKDGYGKSMTVTVIAQNSTEDIELAVPEQLELDTDSYTYIDARTNDAGAYLTYRSSNEDIATVSRTGKVLAKSDGVAYITTTAASGKSATTRVVVGHKAGANEISLAVNVYYNDNDHSFFSNEYGEPITVTGDGTYTLTFDCEEDLSDAAAKAGVDSLSKMTAIYIKDHAVTLGQEKKSKLVSCNIMYDSVVVDGVELTVTQTEPKSALKSSGIFDTNDPINSWDGSMVEEVSVKKHVADFTTVENPKTVEITFTLSDMEFEGTDDMENVVVDVEGMELEVIDNEDGTYDIVATVAPIEANEKIYFASEDEAVAVIAEPTVQVTDGKAAVTAKALKIGGSVITAYSESGVAASILLGVSGITEYVSEADSVGDIIPAPEMDIKHEESTEETAETTSGADTTARESETQQTTQEPDTEPVQADVAAGNVSTMTAILIIAGVVVAAAVVVFVILKPKKKSDSKE